MFSAGLKVVTNTLDSRYLVNIFLPSLIFWSLLLFVAVSTHPEVSDALNAWINQTLEAKILQSVSFFSGVLFFSGLASARLNSILRMYEGYWNFLLSRYLKRLGERWHQSRLCKLYEKSQLDIAAYEEIYLRYPMPSHIREEVMPTSPGNILKNSELYPNDRYNIDAVLIWPRLYNLFPQRFAQTIADARSGLDFMLMVSSLNGAFALISGGYLLVVSADWWLFPVCFGGGLLVAWLAYRSALGAAVLYAQLIKAAFDLYRNQLLTHMRLRLPHTWIEERATWGQVNQFLYRGIPIDSKALISNATVPPPTEGGTVAFQRIVTNIDSRYL